MKTVWLHQFFRIEFKQILEDSRRQEKIHPANKGEYAIARGMLAYFDTVVLPLILSNEWVFEAAERFASEFAPDCFQWRKVSGEEAHRTQIALRDLNEKTITFLVQAFLDGNAPRAGEVDLAKASDFFELLDLESLSETRLAEAVALRQKAEEHEALQVFVTLRGIRDCYETPLPRVMYVVRRAMKVQLGLPAAASDAELTGISELMDWYEARIDPAHGLHPVFGQLRRFYRIARNVGSHHEGIRWDPIDNEVVLPDRKLHLRVPLHEYQQKYRHLVYLCELGLRGMLSAFCERERGPVSNQLVHQYVKTFPQDFPEGEKGIVKFYPA